MLLVASSVKPAKEEEMIAVPSWPGYLRIVPVGFSCSEGAVEDLCASQPIFHQDHSRLKSDSCGGEASARSGAAGSTANQSSCLRDVTLNDSVSIGGLEQNPQSASRVTVALRWTAKPDTAHYHVWVGWSESISEMRSRLPSDRQYMFCGIAVLPRFKVVGLEVPSGCSGARFIVQRVDVLGHAEAQGRAASVIVSL